jgi:alpha-L-rhamnosidase
VAKIAHNSPYGKIVSSWKQADGKTVWEVTVPPNSAATALIPAADAAAIREGGKPLAEAGLAAEPGPHGTTRCELPAGSYRFEFQAVSHPINPR